MLSPPQEKLASINRIRESVLHSRASVRRLCGLIGGTAAILPADDDLDGGLSTRSRLDSATSGSGARPRERWASPHGDPPQAHGDPPAPPGNPDSGRPRAARPEHAALGSRAAYARRLRRTPVRGAGRRV
ncbi:hypothetical protein GCM10009863_34570 [Streptomyces axinellae]|uniref:Uncharacterized protein n=1 Tax=Streptomyces axinellae TaxID=552788 RepID=A0ABN3Q5X4_9ACTN